ncbi:5'-3' exonuclease [Nocardioides acrostichi]|uniref:5'-3' exonuclease n=1 Tax=Nocardioides acrostichi TaxID=2784339 RepID=A0A930UZS4_9ACTN|nr:5'-3' exonuclease H3TH domain-containing protein [Nocardioides acrostichi]MBF4162747.1 5'-3' exonuclease [Nocardioides acrostichi]
MPAPADRPLLLAVDAPSLLHRGHHAHVGSGRLDRGGRPAWALHGMLRLILQVLEDLTPDAVVFGLDDRRASVRAERYPAYKAGRKPKEPELVEQLDRAPGFLAALGLHAVQPEGLEADDVSASAASLAEASGWRCTIATSDRDAFAHISEHTSVLRLITGGIASAPLLTPARLHTMYGVPAAQYLEYAALRGDASDNLPGVAGIGEKSAALLLAVAGDMAAAWTDVELNAGDALRPALDDACEAEGRSRVGRRVVTALTSEGARERYDFNVEIMRGRDDLDLGLDLSRLQHPGPGVLPLDPDRVRRVVDHLDDPTLTDHALRVLARQPTGDGAAGAVAPAHR